MDRTSGWRSRKDSSLRKASCEHLCAVFPKRGASGRHNKLVRKIRHDVSIPKEVRECRYEKQEAEAEAILHQIISNAPLGVKFSIEAVNKGLEASVSEGLLLEASLFAVCAGSEDKKEGTSAFLAKRAPQFQGR